MARALHQHAARAAAFAVLCLVIACRGQGGDGPPDAGRAAPAPPRAPPRAPAGTGEILADLEASKISLAIVKDREVTAPVTATMALRDGRLSLSGDPASARFVIDLETFDSRIPLRNERVKQFFFETQVTSWDVAELVIAKIPDELAAAVRERRNALGARVEAELKLHGRAGRIAMKIDVTRRADGALEVKSSAPMELKISDFGLGDNLRRLSALCMHDSIDDVVKVEVALAFQSR